MLNLHSEVLAVLTWNNRPDADVTIDGRVRLRCQDLTTVVNQTAPTTEQTNDTHN